MAPVRLFCAGCGQRSMRAVKMTRYRISGHPDWRDAVKCACDCGAVILLDPAEGNMAERILAHVDDGSDRYTAAREALNAVQGQG